MPPKPTPTKGATSKKAPPSKAAAKPAKGAAPAAKGAGASKGAGAAKPAAKQEKPKMEEARVMMGKEIGLKALATTLESDEVKNSGRWPLLIDPSGNSVTFLKYRNTNMLYAGVPMDMAGPPIRRAVLGSVRYGKPLVINLEEIDDYATLKEHFDKVLNYPGLLEAIMDKSLLKDDNYKKLMTSEDGDEYQKAQYFEWKSEDFSFVLASMKEEPSQDLCGRFYTLKIV